MKSIAAAIGLAALAAIASAQVPLLPDQTNALTPIDTVPTRQQLDNTFLSSTNALDTLSSLALDTNSDPSNPTDIGVRLRAIHALAKYCTSTPCQDSDVAHQTLLTVINTDQHETSGSNLLLLRAAIETIGGMRITADHTLLENLLNHPSRDIRAATARALEDLCYANASVPLRTRYTQEGTDQVKLAISEALRILEQCSAN